ncbi:MAG TPA: hypothetical protein VGI99_00410 [Gemmataceae bacterium]
MSKTKKPARMHPKARKPAPTLAEVRAIVRAWAAENWPDALHVSMTQWSAPGGAVEEIDLLGPPTDEPWFTNRLRPFRRPELDALQAEVAAIDAEDKEEPEEEPERPSDDAVRAVVMAWLRGRPELDKAAEVAIVAHDVIGAGVIFEPIARKDWN